MNTTLLISLPRRALDRGTVRGLGQQFQPDLVDTSLLLPKPRCGSLLRRRTGEAEA